jgi:hypothetical protein
MRKRVLFLESGGRYWQEPEHYQLFYGTAICSNRWASSQLWYSAANVRARCRDVSEIFILDATIQELTMQQVINFVEENRVTHVVLFGTRTDSNRCSNSTFDANKKFARALRRQVSTIHITCYSAHAYINPAIYWREFDSVIVGTPEDGVVDAINGDRMKEYYSTDLQKMESPSFLGLDTSLFYSSELNWNFSEKGKFRRRLSFLPVPTSRGCAFRCSFCTVFYAFGSNEAGQRILYRSYDKLRQDLINAREAGWESWYAMDDYFLVNKEHTKEVCRIAKEVGLPWSCQTRADLLIPENLDLIQDANCIEVGVGIENPSAKLLENMDKKLEFEKADRILREASERTDLSLLLFTIVGYPGETQEDYTLLKSYCSSFGEKIKGSGASIAIPYPGTEYHRDCVRAGLIPKDDLRVTTACLAAGLLDTDLKTFENVRLRWLDFDLNVSKPSFMESIREEYPIVYEKFMNFDWEPAKKVLNWCEE